MYALSLDMGGSHIGCAVVRDRKIMAHTSIATTAAHGLAPLLPEIRSTLNALLRESSVTAADCSGVAIGFPGIVDFRTATIHSTLKKYEDAVHLDLAAWCRNAFDLPLRMENDARMALLGEQYAGSARGHEDVIMMTLGTGIGGAAMIHGHLLRGKHAQAGCLGGHLPVDFNGRECACGNIGCAEAEASGWSMPLVAREWPGFSASSLSDIPHLGFKQLFEHADHGDTVAQAVLDRCLKVWGSNAVANIHAYDPDVVIIGGGAIKSGDRIIASVQSYVDAHVWTGGIRPQVRAAQLGNLAGLLGAIPLISEDPNGAAL
jgi:glucokinase